MEPVTITIIVVLCALATRVGIALPWEQIFTILLGKRIAVLGAKGAGKTTLLHHLKMLNMEALEREQTRTAEKTRSSSIDLNIGGKNETIYLKSTIDLPGSEEGRTNGWKGSVENSDLVLYIVHAAALLRGIDKSNNRSRQKEADEIKKETELRVEDDLRNIQCWIKELGENNIPVFIIGSHFDEIKENFSDRDNIEDYENEFNNHKVIRNFGQGMIKIIGSLKTSDTMKDILERVVKEIKVKM
jgi:GTPase SAR1 family protein